MCGIALILSRVKITGCNCLRSSYFPPNFDVSEPPPAIPLGDLEAALRRRGPDSLGTRKVQVEEDIVNAEVELFGATLQLRGQNPIVQPLADSSGNLLVFNGEIFGGIEVAADSNDAEALLAILEKCGFHDPKCNIGSCHKQEDKAVPGVLSAIRGPWALIYWQAKSKTLWFGRDAIGRRSLLVHWPTYEDSCFVLSSVSPLSMTKDLGSLSSSKLDSDFAADGIPYHQWYWQELPCGIYSIHLQTPQTSQLGLEKNLACEMRVHEWSNPSLNELIKWERKRMPSENEENGTQNMAKPVNHMVKARKDLAGPFSFLRNGTMQSVQKVICALKESVMRRTVFNTPPQQRDLCQNGEKEEAPIAVLFSGGLDSMILAALLDQCLDSKYAIDLLNVSFDGELAPDRISAREGVTELQCVAPFRRWRLVEIDASLSGLTRETKHIMSLIHPSETYMDLNIGIALWLAARGDGWVHSQVTNNNGEIRVRNKFTSKARVLLVGSGADEQCAGYGRHRTKFRLGGLVALEEEMRLDMQRIWKRNLGRDDRCISDHGKEARFPFLDEDVIKTLLEIPLSEIADLSEPIGSGDKKILREVALLLGLEKAARMPKRAIQFGSRIARESNRAHFGSNRAANQASAGSVVIGTNTR